MPNKGLNSLRLCIALLFIMFTHEVIAQRYVMSLPIKPTTAGGVFLGNQKVYSKKTGLALDLIPRGFAKYGYRPIEVVLKASKASKVDRKVVIQITQSSYSNFGISKDEHLYELTLPADLVTATKEFYLPPYTESDSTTDIMVLVDGEKDKELSIERTGAIFNTAVGMPNWSSNWARCYTPFGKDVSAIRFQNQSGLLDGNTVVEPFNEDWIFYSSADAVVIPASMLERTLELSPAKFEGLKEWVASGGNLWITRCRRTNLKPDQIVSLLSLEDWSFNRSKPLTQRKPTSAGWHFDSLIRKDKNADKEKSDTINTDGDLLETIGNALKSMAQNPDSKGWYAWYPYGFGRVYAFEKHPLEGHSTSPPANRIGYEEISKRNWSKRHGIGPDCQSSQYADLLVPGIGMAPVLEFQGLITLFVLLIGPLNYWLLWRADKLHLFVLTTPLFAAFITLCLMGYGVVCDGFGNQARARSVTFLNQPQGKAVSWSRITNYSGSPPKEGIVMPKGTSVYPILPVYNSMGGGARYERLTKWQDKQQFMQSGWFPSRTAVQFLAIKSTQTDKNIQVLADQNRVEIRNNLGTKIDLLLVQKEEGDWYLGEQISEEEKVVLKPIQATQAITRFRILVVESQPVMPEGGDLDAARDLGILNVNRSRSFNDGQELSDNLLNRELNRLAGIDGNQGLEIPANSYLAVTSEATETPFGVGDVVESGSFHVTVGKWQ